VGSPQELRPLIFVCSALTGFFGAETLAAAVVTGFLVVVVVADVVVEVVVDVVVLVVVLFVVVVVGIVDEVCGKKVTTSELGFGGLGGLVGLLFLVVQVQDVFSEFESTLSIELSTGGKYCLFLSHFGGFPGGLGGMMTTCDEGWAQL